MSNPAPSPTAIPRKELARYVTDENGAPIEKLIQDLEEQQEFVLTGLPAAVAAAQTTADAAATELQTSTFLSVNAEPLLLNSRQLVMGAGIRATDGGPGAAYTIELKENNVILPADVSDNTGAFVNATGLLSALEVNSVYVVDAALAFQSASLVVGIGLAFTLPAAATINGGWRHFTTLTAENGGYNIASGTVSGNTAGVPIINSNNPITGRWVIRTAATAGNAQLRFRSSAAATLVTLKQDLSILTFRKVG